jgi:hypothetical protein
MRPNVQVYVTMAWWSTSGTRVFYSGDALGAMRNLKVSSISRFDYGEITTHGADWLHKESWGAAQMQDFKIAVDELINQLDD